MWALRGIGMNWMDGGSNRIDMRGLGHCKIGYDKEFSHDLKRLEPPLVLCCCVLQWHHDCYSAFLPYACT